MSCFSVREKKLRAIFMRSTSTYVNPPHPSTEKERYFSLESLHSWHESHVRADARAKGMFLSSNRGGAESGMVRAGCRQDAVDDLNSLQSVVVLCALVHVRAASKPWTGTSL